jgi:hypothetical protein
MCGASSEVACGMASAAAGGIRGPSCVPIAAVFFLRDRSVRECERMPREDCS